MRELSGLSGPDVDARAVCAAPAAVFFPSEASLPPEVQAFTDIYLCF